MISPHIDSRRAPWLAIVAALALAGCYEDNEGHPAPDADPLDAALPMEDGAPPIDAAPPIPDAQVDAGPELCADDDDCAGRSLCAAGECAPAPDAPVFALPVDGLTRAGAAPFDVVPTYLEPWFDRAGPDCPDNRPGVFDGELLVAEPDDACRDGFEDADGDGLFDAVWMAGAGLDRPAWGIDERRPPAGRVLLLTRDERAHLLVTLDVFAIDPARLDALVERVARRLGIEPEAIAVHATGTRTGPDAVGLWGPSLLAGGEPGGLDLLADLGPEQGLLGELPRQSGVSQAWWMALADRVAAAARQAAADAGPVEVRAATVRLPLPDAPAIDGPIIVPDADGDGVENDADDLAAWRTAPGPVATDTAVAGLRDPEVWALALDAVDSERTRVVVAGWSAAPAAAGPGLLDADHPGAVRARLEAAVPDAVAVWLTGAGADTWRTGGDAFVPAVDDDGALLGPDGAVVDNLEAAAPAADPVDALGALIAGRVLDALDDAEPAPAELAVRQRFVWVPVSNPRFDLAARLDIIGPLGDWLTGRRQTDGWASAETAPGCGGAGCLRYRLDLLDLGPVALLTTPGALDRAFVDGRLDARLDLGDGRNLDDLDLDGRPDAQDDDIRIGVRWGPSELMVTLPGPANPQRFPAIRGLARDGLWIVGRTNGGVGSLRTPVEQINVFEGQLDPLTRLSRQDPERLLCGVSFPCGGRLELGQLVDRVRSGLPERLVDLPGTRELRLDPPLAPGGPFAWRIEDPDGVERAAGERLMTGPRDRAFTGDVDLVAAGVEPGDTLILAPEGIRSTVVERVPIELRRHPNVGDAWQALSPDGGDMVYNAACELVFEGPCPTRRPVDDDPNAGLPRTP